MTLLLACVFASGWVRSGYQTDVFTLQQSETLAHELFSDRGHLGWKQWKNVGYEPQQRFFGSWNAAKSEEFIEKHNPFFDIDTDWVWEYAGFHCGSGHCKNGSHWPIVLLLIPYWSIVVPMTLISAWLLLSKPHKSTLKKSVEPISNDEK